MRGDWRQTQIGLSLSYAACALLLGYRRVRGGVRPAPFSEYSDSHGMICATGQNARRLYVGTAVRHTSGNLSGLRANSDVCRTRTRCRSLQFVRGRNNLGRNRQTQRYQR
jgi:hypothetical protein